MTGLTQIIGDLFFFGKLSRCRFEWHKSLSDADTGETFLGSCCLPDRHSRDWFVIQMLSTDTHSLQPSKSHFTALMSVLLHECVHGFFELYSCEYTCQSEECSMTTRRALGDTGHGEAWQIVASHGEALARRYLVKSVRIHIPISLGVEFEKSGLGTRRRSGGSTMPPLLSPCLPTISPPRREARTPHRRRQQEDNPVPAIDPHPRILVKMSYSRSRAKGSHC